MVCYGSEVDHLLEPNYQGRFDSGHLATLPVVITSESRNRTVLFDQNNSGTTKRVCLYLVYYQLVTKWRGLRDDFINWVIENAAA